MKENEIGYEVLKIKHGFLQLVDIAIGVDDNGVTKTYDEQYLDDQVGVALEMSGGDRYNAYTYNLTEGFSLYILVAESSVGVKPSWRDIFNSDIMIMSVLIDDKPISFTTDALTVAINLYKAITEAKEYRK